MNGFELILPFLRPIEHLILDPEISEIMVNGPERIFIETHGHIEAVPGITLSQKSLEVAVRNIARRLGDDISEEKPILDSRLPDGSRVAAVVPPCSLNGVTLTIRKFNAKHFGIEDLIAGGTLTAELAQRLRSAVLNHQKHPHLWRNRHRQDDSSQRPRKLHSRTRTHSRHRGHRGDSDSNTEPGPL